MDDEVSAFRTRSNRKLEPKPHAPDAFAAAVDAIFDEPVEDRN